MLWPDSSQVEKPNELFAARRRHRASIDKWQHLYSIASRPLLPVLKALIANLESEESASIATILLTNQGR